MRSCSAATELAPSSVGGAPRLSGGGSGTPAAAALRPTTALESATSDTIFIAVQRPAARDRATAWRPRRTTSPTSAGLKSGSTRLSAISSHELGKVDDL